MQAENFKEYMGKSIWELQSAWNCVYAHWLHKMRNKEVILKFTWIFKKWPYTEPLICLLHSLFFEKNLPKILFLTIQFEPDPNL